MIISVFQMRNCDSQSLDKLLKITSLVNDMESVKFSLLPAECKGFSTNKHSVASSSGPTSPSPRSAFQMGTPHPLHSTHLELASV